MNAFNPAQFRAQFPALNDAGVYLDSAATALKPQTVIEATHQFYSLSAGNVHRSQFAEAQRLTARYEAAREKVARLINAPDDKTIVWTRGTTEAINMVAQSYARPRLQPGDEIIVSVAEHHANLVPRLMVAQQTGAGSSDCRSTRSYFLMLSVCPSSSPRAVAYWRWDRCLTSPAAARI